MANICTNELVYSREKNRQSEGKGLMRLIVVSDSELDIDDQTRGEIATWADITSLYVSPPVLDEIDEYVRSVVGESDMGHPILVKRPEATDSTTIGVPVLPDRLKT